VQVSKRVLAKHYRAVVRSGCALLLILHNPPTEDSLAQNLPICSSSPCATNLRSIPTTLTHTGPLPPHKTSLDGQSSARRSYCHHKVSFRQLSRSFTGFTLKGRAVLWAELDCLQWWQYSRSGTAKSSLETSLYLARP
jgi:hypothetical protein